MGVQKYRADIAGDVRANGSQPFYAVWMGGPTLALIRNCPVDMEGYAARTVYITGEPDTFFSIPAAIRLRGKRIKGFVTSGEDGYTFHANKF